MYAKSKTGLEEYRSSGKAVHPGEGGRGLEADDGGILYLQNAFLALCNKARKEMREWRRE